MALCADNGREHLQQGVYGTPQRRTPRGRVRIRASATAISCPPSTRLLDYIVGEGAQGMRLQRALLDRENVVSDVAALAALAFNELANSLSCSEPSIFWVRCSERRCSDAI